MKVKEKKLDNGKYLLEAEASASEVNTALQNAQMIFAQSMGLRPEGDKSIEQVAKEQMGITDLDSVIIPQAIEALVPFALDKRNIVPIYMQQPVYKTTLRRNQPFEFSFEVLPKPQYELTSYEPVEIKAPKYEFDDSIIDAQVEEMASNYISYKKDEDASADRTVEPDDVIKIKIEATENGERITGLCTEGRTYSVGKGYMPKSFEREVIGMKAGETKSFSFEGPDFDEDMNETTKEVDATVTVLEFQKQVVPTIDDEWVQKNMPSMKNLATLKNSIRENLEGGAKAQYNAYLRQLAASAAAKRFEGSIPNEAYEFSRDNLLKSIRAELQNQGKTWESFVQENGGEQAFTMMLMLQVREMLTQGFALDAVFKHVGLTLSDEDIKIACQEMNPQMNPDYMRKQMEQAGQGFTLREAAQRLKANNYLLENAKIEYADEADTQK